LDSVVVTLIRTNFYVTETTVHKNLVFYYRQDLWSRISLPAIKHLCSTVFEELPQGAADAIDPDCLGVSRLRLLPKQVGLRPLVNLRASSKNIPGNNRPHSDGNPNTPSINNLLQNLFHTLLLEKVSWMIIQNEETSLTFRTEQTTLLDG